MGGYFVCNECGKTWVDERVIGTSRVMHDCPNCKTNLNVYEVM